MSGLILAKGIDERGSSKVRLATRDFSVRMAHHVEIFGLVCAACNKILESLQCRTDSSGSSSQIIWLPATRSLLFAVRSILFGVSSVRHSICTISRERV